MFFGGGCAAGWGGMARTGCASEGRGHPRCLIFKEVNLSIKPQEWQRGTVCKVSLGGKSPVRVLAAVRAPGPPRCSAGSQSVLAQLRHWEGSAPFRKAWLHGEHVYALVSLATVNTSVFITI